MAKSNRGWARDKIQASINSHNSAIAHLEPLIITYDKDHGDISQVMTMCQLVVGESRDLLIKLRESF